MRVWLPALILLPLALTACPALLSDWTTGGSGAADASTDTSSGSTMSSGGASSGSGGSAGSAGGSGGAGGSSGAGGAGGSSSSDAGGACVTDLAGVGTGDFRIAFTVTTTARMNVALLSQRIGCDQSSMLWGVTLNYNGQIAAATADGVAGHWAATTGANSVADGRPHAIVFVRTSGKIWISRDGVVDSIPVDDPYSLGALPPLRIGTDDGCLGFWSAQVAGAVISNVCISSAQGSTSGTDAGTCDAGATCGVAPPSCQGLPATCGPASNESCCTSLLVTGGAFYRSYDGVSAGYTSQAYPATVSDFRLDKYEVTVGRFRKFKAAWDGGWRPAAGDGRHTHLNGGSGLANSGAAGYEPGWDTAWAPSVAPTDVNLSCAANQTWTSSAGANENRPMNCPNWYEQYAFCIWDGGFLPSEAEWNYAAAGGSEQRVYPWSTPPTSTSIDDTRAVYCGGSCSTTQNVGVKPAGNGKYGQADLAGNLWEWTLDGYALYEVTCSNCSYLSSGASGRVVRGGDFYYDASALLSAGRYVSVDPAPRNSNIGSRCARSAP
jgi:formylglycine-generating enzyme required for sulfatase activity